MTWFKDGVEIGQNKTEGRLITKDQTLIIKKARRSSKHDDTGVYQCLAKNEAGEERSKLAVVKVRCKYCDWTFTLNCYCKLH